MPTNYSKSKITIQRPNWSYEEFEDINNPRINIGLYGSISKSWGRHMFTPYELDNLSIGREVPDVPFIKKTDGKVSHADLCIERKMHEYKVVPTFDKDNDRQNRSKDRANKVYNFGHSFSNDELDVLELGGYVAYKNGYINRESNKTIYNSIYELFNYNIEE